MSRFLISIMLAFFTACSYTGARAQSEAFEAEHYYRYMPARKAEAQPGKIAVTEAASDYSYQTNIFGKLPFEFSLATKYIGLDDAVQLSLPAQLTELAIGLEATVPLFNFKNTYFRMSVSPSFLGDSWNFESSDFRIPSHYIFIWQPDDKWTWVCGAAYTPDSISKHFPIFGFIYRPNQKLAFDIILERPNITYALNDKTTVFVEGDMSFGEYETKKDGSNGAILEYRELHAGVGVAYNFNKYIESSLSLGRVFSRTLQYQDSLGKVNIENGIYSELRVVIKI